MEFDTKHVDCLHLPPPPPPIPLTDSFPPLPRDSRHQLMMNMQSARGAVISNKDMIDNVCTSPLH